MDNIIIGRDNISATIFVPYDCTNKCKFCTTKHLYKKNIDYTTTLLKIEESIIKLSNIGITIWTLTGGEPLDDLDKCKDIINLIKKHTLFEEELTIFINTSLPKTAGIDNIISFLEDEENYIKGISVSRHKNSYEEDCKLLHNIFEDELLSKIKLPIRINCLVSKDLNIKEFVERFINFENILINFRANYTKIKLDTIHQKDDFFKQLNQLYNFQQHTECNVCDTDIFQYKNTYICYHKGCLSTAIRNNDGLEINDFVISMFGELYFDWIFVKKNRVPDSFFRKINELYE